MRVDDVAGNVCLSLWSGMWEFCADNFNIFDAVIVFFSLVEVLVLVGSSFTVGTGRYCPPRHRHPTHYDTSFLEFNGEQLLRGRPSFTAVSSLRMLRSLRVLKTFRVFRVFKMFRYLSSLRIIGEVILSSLSTPYTPLLNPLHTPAKPLLTFSCAPSYTPHTPVITP